MPADSGDSSAGKAGGGIDSGGAAEAPDASFHPGLFAGLAISIAWTSWAPLLIQVSGLATLPVPYPVALFVCQTLGAFSPLLALVAIQRVRHEPGLVERVLRKIRVRKVPLRWFLLPALVPVLVAIVTNVVHTTISRGEAIAILRPDVVEEVGWALVFVIPFTFVVALIGSPLGEEPGWRGYLLDSFTRRGRGLSGSAFIAALWWTWHVPLLVVLGVRPDGWSFLEMAGHSLLIDSFFVLSRRNLLVAMLYHQGVNISFMFFELRTRTIVGLAILLALALSLRLWSESRLRAGLGSPHEEAEGSSHTLREPPG